MWYMNVSEKGFTPFTPKSAISMRKWWLTVRFWWCHMFRQAEFWCHEAWKHPDIPRRGDTLRPRKVGDLAKESTVDPKKRIIPTISNHFQPFPTIIILALVFGGFFRMKSDETSMKSWVVSTCGLKNSGLLVDREVCVGLQVHLG